MGQTLITKITGGRDFNVGMEAFKVIALLSSKTQPSYDNLQSHLSAMKSHFLKANEDVLRG